MLNTRHPIIVWMIGHLWFLTSHHETISIGNVFPLMYCYSRELKILRSNTKISRIYYVVLNINVAESIAYITYYTLDCTITSNYNTSSRAFLYIYTIYYAGHISYDTTPGINLYCIITVYRMTQNKDMLWLLPINRL